MTDSMTAPDTGEHPPPPPAHGGQVVEQARFTVVALAAYAVVGAVLGWLWFTLWTPHDGQVFGHQWYAGGDALRGEFSGTGLYFLVGATGGLVLGVAASLLGGRHPITTLLVAVTGAVLAGYLMLTVGETLGPDDPAVAAKTAKDGTTLPSPLRVTGFSPHLSVPMGTLAGVAAVFVIFPGSRPKRT